MRWFSHQHRTGRRKAPEDRPGPKRDRSRKPTSTCTAVTPSSDGMVSAAAYAAYGAVVHALLCIINEDDSAVFRFCTRVTFTFDLVIRTRARFLYNVPLTANFRHPTFNRSEVIVQIKHTDKQTNRHRWKHHCAPLYATPVGNLKSQWQNIGLMSVSATHGGHSNVNIGFNLE